MRKFSALLLALAMLALLGGCNPEQYGHGAQGSGGSPLLALIPLGVGLFMMLAPRADWFLRGGWKYKDAEPSDMALGCNRAFGGVLVFVGIIWFLIAMFS